MHSAATAVHWANLLVSPPTPLTQPFFLFLLAPGLVKFTVHDITLTSAKKGYDYFCTVSIGRQTFLSRDARADAATNATLAVRAGAEFVLQKGGASIARVALFRRGRLEGALHNNLCGYCEVDLASYFGASTPNLQAGASGGNGSSSSIPNSSVVVDGVFDLEDAENDELTLGTVRLSGSASTLEDLERQVWERLLLLADWDGDGALSLSELSVLMAAFGSDATPEELEALFEYADKDKSGSVDVTELSELLSLGDLDGSTFHRLLKRCPVDGAELSHDPAQAASNLIYVWLALAATQSSSEAELKAGYQTEAQAARSWALRLSEWASHPLYVNPAARRKRFYKSGGLRVGDAASHILVFNRAEKRVEEEAISPLLSLAMRTLYQSTVGRGLMRQGLTRKLASLSVKEGKYRDSPESAKDIRPFVESFKGQIDVNEAELPLDQYQTFNQFFYRKLKPGSRPVASPDDPDVVVSAADCRLQVFESVDEATRFWIKGRNFSIAGLLADTDPERQVSKAFAGGTMAIFRLAPQGEALRGSVPLHEVICCLVKSQQIHAHGAYFQCLDYFRTNVKNRQRKWCFDDVRGLYACRLPPVPLPSGRHRRLNHRRPRRPSDRQPHRRQHRLLRCVHRQQTLSHDD